ncbi:hypothetical protein J7L48_00850 [bacterium]|nr:hypothetical protein [bacterium]
MRKSIILYEHGKYENSINVLNRILSEDERYYTAKYYLMLNYFKLQWWEMSLEQAKELLPYTKDNAQRVVVSYVSQYCVSILSEHITPVEKKEFLELKRKHKKVFKKYGLK